MTTAFRMTKQRKPRLFILAAIICCIGLGVLMALQAETVDQLIANPIPLITVTVGTLMIILAYLQARDWLVPTIPFIFVWTVAIFLVSLNVEYRGFYAFFNRPLHLQTWLVVIGALLFFVISCTYILTLPYKKEETAVSHMRPWDARRVQQAIWFSFAGGTAVFAYSVLRSGVIPLFADSVYLARIGFRPPFWNNFYALFMVVIVLTAVRIVTAGWKNSLDSILLSLLSLIIFMLTTQRNDAWQSFMIMGVVFLVLRQRKATRHHTFTRKELLWLTGGLVALVFVFIQVGEIRQLGTSRIVNIENSALSQLYIYMGAPAIKNLQRVLQGEVLVQAKGGWLLLRPILWYLRIREPVTVTNVFTGPNTSTFLYYYYLDFGFVGVLLIPMFLGLICGLLYRQMKRSPSILWVVWYGLLMSCIIWTPNTERFFEPSTLWYAILFGLVHLYCQERQENKQLEI